MIHIHVPVSEQLTKDQNAPWQVVPRQVIHSLLPLIDFICVGCSQLCSLSLDNQCVLCILSRLVVKPTMWFPNRSDTNRPVQAQKTARSMEFRI